MDFLKSPQLVADIQRFFGVKVRRNYSNEQSGKQDHQQSLEATNFLWHNLFRFGTELGDELFYSTFIPFCFWNMDAAIGRRVILVWAIVMYTGQSCKDLLGWPRPGPPVVRLAKKWSLEYGMPSTHAMVAVSIPFSTLYYSINRYDYNYAIGFAIALAWCFLVCVSRIYLGMHSVLDIVGGLSLAISIMVPLIPLVDRLDIFILTYSASPVIIFIVSVLMLVLYPKGTKWTPTRADTALVLGVTVAVLMGSWLNFHTGLMSLPMLTPPYVMAAPTLHSFYAASARVVIGFVLVFVVRSAAKWSSFHVLCALTGQQTDIVRNNAQSNNSHILFVVLSTKYFTTWCMGFSILNCIPFVFIALGIDRKSFFTDM